MSPSGVNPPPINHSDPAPPMKEAVIRLRGFCGCLCASVYSWYRPAGVVAETISRMDTTEKIFAVWIISNSLVVRICFSDGKIDFHALKSRKLRYIISPLRQSFGISVNPALAAPLASDVT